MLRINEIQRKHHPHKLPCSFVNIHWTWSWLNFDIDRKNWLNWFYEKKKTYGAENLGTLHLTLGVDDHAGVVLEVDHNAIGTAPLLTLTDDACEMDLLTEFGLTFLDSCEDEITGGGLGQTVQKSESTIVSPVVYDNFSSLSMYIYIHICAMHWQTQLAYWSVSKAIRPDPKPEDFEADDGKLVIPRSWAYIEASFWVVAWILEKSCEAKACSRR